MAINLRDGMRFGIGIDSSTEDVRAEAVIFDGITNRDGGQTVTSNVKMIESQESLSESMNISVSASVRYGLAELDAKMSFAQQNAVNEYSLYMLFNAEVRNPPRNMIAPRLTDEAEATYRRDPEEFRQIYGDSYIDEIYTGGELFGLFIFHTRDESSRTELNASLRASIGGFFAGGEISAEFKSTTEQAKKQANMEIKAWMSGGAGLQNPQDLDDLKELHKHFNQAVLEHPLEYAVSIKNFRYLPLPLGPTWVEQLVRKDTIESCGKYVIESIKLRSKLEYILANPSQFESPNLDELRAKLQLVNERIPKWAHRAYECSKDIAQCSLACLESVIVSNWPTRIITANPLEEKWRYILEHDERARPYFSEGFHPKIAIGPDFKYDEHNGGQYWVFRENNVPKGGIFWHPGVDEGRAHIVYGPIFDAYMSRGHCEGHLGYPISDEGAMDATTGWLKSADVGSDRVSFFEHGVLWWDKETEKVLDKLPKTLHEIMFRKLNEPNNPAIFDALDWNG